MGYNIKLVGCDFWIGSENADEALEALRHRTEPDRQAWMNRATPEEWDYLKEALEDWRFMATLDDERNIVGLQFIGEKVGDENVLFDTLAPYVGDESYLEFQGADGERWRYVFEGGDVEKVYGEVTFE